MNKDPHTSAVIASVMGGFLYGLARIYAVAFSPTPSSARDLRNALALAVCSSVSAGIGGYYVAPGILYLLNVKDDELRGLLTVIIGIGFWQAIPGLQKLSSLIYGRLFDKIDRLTGGQGSKQDGITQ